MSKQEVTFKTTTKIHDAVHVLEDLVGSLKSGAVRIRSNGESVTLSPEPLAKLKIEAAQSEDRESLCIRLSWSKQAADMDDLKITPAEEDGEQDAHAASTEQPVVAAGPIAAP